jgi:hypothetical protein
MGQFLEECKSRLAEAQKRFQEAQQNMAMATQAFQVAQNEMGIWNGAVATEMRRLELEKQQKPSGVPSGVPPEKNLLEQSSSVPNAEVNKTDMIRDILRQHPAGMTPAELWKALNGQVARDYVYAVLKRLKDREEVAYKRKKYSLRAQAAAKTENAQSSVILQ